MRSPSSTLAGLWALALLAVPAVARAQDGATTASPATLTAEQEASAREHFRRGLALFESRDFNGALAEFQAAYDISRRPSVLYNIGATYLELHQYPEAARAIEQHLREATLTPERRAQVEQALAQIQGFIGHVTLEGLPDGAAVTIDGQPVGTAPFAAPTAVGTGRHVIVATAEGYHDARETVLVAGGQTRQVRLALQRVSAAPVAAASREGVLVVAGVPPGGTVAIDGRPAAPRQPRALAPGRHRVRVQARGFVPWEGAVDVAAGATRVVTVRLADAGRWSPLPLAVAAAGTVALGTAALVMGANTLATHAAFRTHHREDEAAAQLMAIGVQQRTVTNVLLGATAVAGVATVLIFTRTRFGAAAATVDVAAAPRLEGGAEGSVRVRF